MKRILYLHGLESSSGGRKVDFLASRPMYMPLKWIILIKMHLQTY